MQGWAKMRLENWARDFWEREIYCTVYNCPEILTNSSSIFQGVEVSLYPLLGALRKEGANSSYVQNLLERAQDLLKPEHSISHILNFTDHYLNSPTIQKYTNYADWPEHNAREQMELMLASSEELVQMHKDTKVLMTALLSEEVFKAAGHLMLNNSWEPNQPVLWLGHDVIAKQLASRAN
jgi:hypothetical protein